MVFLVSTGTVYSQHTEFTVQIGSGLFAFRGPGAVNETYARSVADRHGYTTNPFSRSSGLYYELTAGLRRVTNSRFIYGLQIGYEAQQSRIAVVGYKYGGPIYDYPDIIREGYALVRNRYATIQPFAGKRFGCGHVDVDATAGLDAGIGLSSREAVGIVSTAGSYTVNTARPIPAVDFRPRLSLTGYYHAFGLSLGYSHGLTNYTTGQYGNDGAYSRFWRAGVVYRFVKRKAFLTGETVRR